MERIIKYSEFIGESNSNSNFSVNMANKFFNSVKKELREFMEKNLVRYEAQILKHIKYWTKISIEDVEEGEEPINPDDPSEMLDIIQDMRDQYDDFNELYGEFNEYPELAGIYRDYLESIIAKYVAEQIKKLPDYQDYLIKNWEALGEEVLKLFPEMSRGKKTGMWDFKSK